MNRNASARVGLLGVGLMGSAMAHRLLNEEIAVVAWDRESSHVEALAQRGADVAGSAGDVVSVADVVITMLPTAEIVFSVVEPLLPQWPQTTIWLQMSSVGAAESDRLTRAAAAHGVTLFDAPVSGSTHPAEEGKLTILASGPESARPAVEPVLEALGSRIRWVGEAGIGSRLKLAANHWMITMVAALAETMNLCELMGLNQEQFVALLDGGPLGAPYVIDKLGEMRRHEYPAGFPVRLAVKDLGLVREVAESSHVEMPLLDAALERMIDASGIHGDDDLAAVYELSSARR
ncbi:MAG: NAD(P)-dependent oxidoreductase [Solirubrobacteraceae bacterium]